jgi:hypothetical protein
MIRKRFRLKAVRLLGVETGMGTDPQVLACHGLDE